MYFIANHAMFPFYIQLSGLFPVQDTHSFLLFVSYSAFEFKKNIVTYHDGGGWTGRGGGGGVDGGTGGYNIYLLYSSDSYHLGQITNKEYKTEVDGRGL